MAEARLDLDTAVRRIVDELDAVPGIQTIDADQALGRVLAAPIDAPMSLPPFRASAMDGYALRSSDAPGDPPWRLPVHGSSYAGHPLTEPVPAGCCIRIFTGAPVPEALDAVVLQEDCIRDGDVVEIREPVRSGDHVRPVGHDIAAGQRLMDAGRCLGAFDIAWLAACGIAEIPVRDQPVVGIFSTGDELRDAGQILAPGQIYDANRVALRRLLSALPVEVRDYGIVGDDAAAIRRLLERADAECHAVVTSGGVSVGDADEVRDVVESLGELRFWKLNLKPGKPLAYGRLSQAAFFGLPGNPVSTVVTALMVVKPALQRLCGIAPSPLLAVPAVLRGGLRHNPGREEFQRGTLQRAGEGLQVTVTGDQSSNRLASFAAANCLIRIAADSGDLDDGSTVTVLPFHGLL